MINIPWPDKEILNNFYEEQKINILKRIKYIKNNKFTRNKKTFNITKNKKIKKILEKFENEKYLKVFLLAKPDTLLKIIQQFENDCFLKKARDKKETLHNVLYSVFVDYGYNKIDKLKFINNIGLNTCPYCNRNYIFTVSKKGSIKAEIDHFYPKTFYPYLASSYFNLIPSCPTCNGFGAKESKDTYRDYHIINPYLIKLNDFKFSIKPQSVDFLDKIGNKKYDYNNFEIEIYGNSDNKKMFSLEELYSQHKDVIVELLIKKAYYPQSYIDELSKFGFNQDEIYRYLLCNYKQENDLHKRPLSKLIKDISEELGLY